MKNINMKISEEDHRKIKIYAASQGIPVSAAIIAMIQAFKEQGKQGE